MKLTLIMESRIMDNLPNDNNNESSTWWRWPLLPFACVLGSIVGSMVMGGVQWLSMKMVGGYSEDGWYFLYIVPIFTSATFGFLWVYISFNMAPKGKKTTAIIMTTSLVILLVLVSIFSLFNQGYGIGQKIQTIIGCISIIVAAVLTIIDIDD